MSAIPPLQTGAQFTFSNLFSIEWWLQYALQSYHEQPTHVLIEVFCIAVIIYLIFRPTYDPRSQEKLTKDEEDKIIEEWKPEPLCPPAPPSNQKVTNFIVDGATGAIVTLEGGKQLLNFSSFNYLGLANRPEIKAAAHQTIDKYGVGSCGPRGFYGTIDVHLDLEAVIAKFLGTAEALIYSDGIATVSSILPAFAKKGDLIVADEAVHFLIQQGIGLSRCNVLYFRHNDADDLARILEDVREKDRRRKRGLYRKFIVVEGIFRTAVIWLRWIA
jgi:serine palmitoyltransferase